MIRRWSLYIDTRRLRPTKKRPSVRTRYYLFGVFDGKRVSLGAFDRKKDTLARKRLVEEQLAAGTFGKQQRGRRTLAEVHKVWWSSKSKSLSKAAAHAYSVSFRIYFLPKLGSLLIDDITRLDIQTFVDGLHLSGLSPGYVRTIYAHLRAFFNNLVDLEIIDKSPCFRIMLPRVQKAQQLKLEPSEIWLLLDLLDFPVRAIVAILGFAGLRVGECLALRWRNIDHQQLHIRVLEAWDTNMREFHDPKTASSRRTVNMLSQLAQILTEYKDSLGAVEPDDLLFPSPSDRNQPLSYNTIRGVFVGALQAAGLPSVNIHSLRHSYASTMLAAGVSVNVVCRNLGHSSPEITWRVYAHEIQENLGESLGRAEELFGEPDGEGDHDENPSDI